VTEVVLEVQALTKSFGGLRAVSDLSFRTTRGEILGVIGPNGSGKTTLFNIVTGVFPSTSGSVHFRGHDISRMTTDAIARLGLVRTFQAATVFRQETVFENIRRGAMFGCIGDPRRLFWKGRVSDDARKAKETAEELLEFAGLSDVARAQAGNLPYGKQKMLGVAIALARRPLQLLMDEPAAGLNPSETETIGELIEQIRSKRGIDVVLVEHDMKMVTSLCDRILALNYGKAIAVGMPADIVAHPEVIEAYLGVDVD